MSSFQKTRKKKINISDKILKASEEGDMNKIKEFFSYSYKKHIPIKLNLIKNKKGETPLFLACKNNHYILVKFFIKKGAYINIKNNKGQTPLDIAEKNNYRDIVELLIREGGKEGTPEYFKHIDPEFEELIEKARSVWDIRGSICDLQGFYQHYGECVNDTLQMMLISSDPIKKKVQENLIYTNYDEFDFEAAIGEAIEDRVTTEKLLKIYVKAFQSRFLRHYLNEEMICELGEKEARDKLYRSSGVYSKISHIAAKYPAYTYSERPQSLENYSEKHGGYNVEIAMIFFKDLCKIFDITYDIEKIKLDDNTIYKNKYDGYFVVISKENHHFMCFYECGKKQFIYDNNAGPIRFEWRYFLNVYMKAIKNNKNPKLFTLNIFDYIYYPVIYLETDNKYITFDSNKKLYEIEYDDIEINTHIITDIIPIIWKGEIEEYNNNAIEEPTRRRITYNGGGIKTRKRKNK